jgi:predicted ATPase/DNA-binding CsgD family transcriptional regulator
MNGIDLTPREQDILNLLCQGYSNKAIAEHLFLAPSTVKWYNNQIFIKLGVNNRIQAVLVAQETNLTSKLSAVPNHAQLPVTLTSFIGRLEAIDQLCQLLSDHRLITLVGMGGIGKTRLAVEVARRFQQQENFVPCFVSLAAYTQSSAVLPAIAESLGILGRSEGKILEQVVECLSHAPTLVILDNFEQLTDSVSVIDMLLHSVAEIRLLVTSRERLRLYGETVFPLEGLSVEQTDPSDSSEAVKLFLSCAQHADATFHPDDQQLLDIVRICRLLQGVPLAIEQAASWIHAMNPSDILMEIHGGLDILRTEARGIESRHHTMRAVIDRSWRRLTPQEREALMCLSVFQGGFHRESALAVAHANLDILSSLLAKSFIRHKGAQRYDMHEIHRKYALEKLTKHGPLAIVRARYMHYFADMVEKTAPQRWYMDEQQIKAMNQLEDDYANLREVIEWSLAEQQGCIALSILSFGAIFFYDRGHSSESIPWTRKALAQCAGDPDLLTRAYFALALQDVHTSDEEHDVYLHWALRSENPELIAVAHWQYGDHMRFHQRYDEAQQSYERALELAPQTEYHSLYSIILSYMGQMYEERGDLDGATHYYRESYDRMKADEVRSATRPRNLGRMLLRKGVEAQACELFREALDNAIHLDSPLWTFETLLVIANYLQTKGEFLYAIQLFAACFHILNQLQQTTELLEEKVAALRAAVGTPAFDESWAIGKALSMAEAVGLAQEQLEALYPH